MSYVNWVKIQSSLLGIVSQFGVKLELFLILLVVLTGWFWPMQLLRAHSHHNAQALHSSLQDPIQYLLIEKGLMPQSPNAVAAPLLDSTSRSTPHSVRGEPKAEQSLEMVMASMDLLDIPYQWGGNNQLEGFDCSGFTRYVYQQKLNILLPRQAHEQANAKSLTPVARDALQPGDLVFFNTLAKAFSHVGIFVGNDKFIHAPRKGSFVRLDNLRLPYWSKRFDGARRIATSAMLANLPTSSPPRKIRMQHPPFDIEARR